MINLGSVTVSDWFLLTLAGEGGSFLSPLLLLPQKLYTFLGDLSSIDPNDNTADKNRGRSGRSNLLWDNAGQARGRATFRAALPLATLKNAFYFPVIHFTIRSLSAAMRFTVSVKYLGRTNLKRPCTARAVISVSHFWKKTAKRGPLRERVCWDDSLRADRAFSRRWQRNDISDPHITSETTNLLGPT